MKIETKQVYLNEKLFDVYNTGIIYSPRSGKFHGSGLTTKTKFAVINVRNGKKNKSFYIHKVVAETFLDGYFEGAIAVHKDGDRTNNSVDNLEWKAREYKGNMKNLGAGARKIVIATYTNGKKERFDSIGKAVKILGINISQMRYYHKKDTFTMKNGIKIEIKPCSEK